MNDERLVELLDQISRAARLASAYVEGMTKVDFLNDVKTQQAVTMNLVIIGEAASRLVQDHFEFTARFPNIPWPQMKGMRNRIAHGYFEINLDLVWDTVQTSLPDLLNQLSSIDLGSTLSFDPRASLPRRWFGRIGRPAAARTRAPFGLGIYFRQACGEIRGATVATIILTWWALDNLHARVEEKRD